MSVYVIGDVHGHLGKLLDLLEDSHLIDDRRNWIGGHDQLWFLGDFFDRGPSGVSVVDLVMRLQAQAADAGGEIRALLGNHEVLFLGAQRFPRIPKFMLGWKRNGGQTADLALVTPQQLAWLRNLPALALVQNRLLMHADAMFYLDYGQTIAEVNESIMAVLHSDRPDDWDQLLDDFSERTAFSSRDGVTHATECLEYYGGRQIIHGHTPIQYLVSEIIAPKTPLIYAEKLCVNVDGGIYLGAPGFVYRLPD